MDFYKPEDINWARKRIQQTELLYASMEIALCPEVHTYSGGLGVLAGDTLRSCADLQLTATGITLLYREGYFHQELTPDGYQQEHPEPWNVEAFTTALPEGRVHVQIEERTVTIEPRVGLIVGEKNDVVPVLLLDTDLEENDPRDRAITNRLYAGDERMRVKQEAILGIGSKRVLRALNCRDVRTFHLNEGHAAFAPMEDVHYLGKYYSFNKPKIHELVKSKHVFTTHTPVPAGHDKFSYELLKEVLGADDFAWSSLELGGHPDCNMTKLALNLSRYSNGVAQKHGEISRKMFPGYAIDAITNGVHLQSWMHPATQELLDIYMPSWRLEPSILEHCYQVIPHEELFNAHQQAKQELISYVQETTGQELQPDTLTVGFARRFAPYKRADLIFSDLDKLRSVASGKLQLIFAGEAHPRDEAGKELIKRVLSYAQQLQGEIEVVFIQDYNMSVAKKLVTGCDLWLNNPLPPKEASGTSGMKAAANGVPNLSTLDGWWIEGITKNPTAGWIIEHREDSRDEISLYDQLEHIIHVYYDHPERWKEHMVHALSLAHYFNTHRMVTEYERRAWSLNIYS